MPQIRLQQLFLHKNILVRMERPRKCQLPTFQWSTVVKEGYAIYYAVKKWRHYIEDTEILLESDAKSLQKFLAGKTDNVKLDSWSLELQGRIFRWSTYLAIKTRQLTVYPSYPLQPGRGITTP